MSFIKCDFCNPESENFHILKSFLPGGDYEYLVCTFSGDSINFKTKLRINGRNQEFAQKWLDDFQMSSMCTMRVERTYPHSGTKNIFKVDLRCQHNTRPRNEKVRERESCKNTDCPAKMGITVKRVVTERKSRSKDPHILDRPTVISINFCHNHAMRTPEILKHRSVLPDVREKILSLFRLGHSPQTALDMHKYDLLLEYGENFPKISQDRALLPDHQFCYRLFYKIVRKQGNVSNAENPDSEESFNFYLNSEKKSPAPLSSCENSSTVNSNLSDIQQIVIPQDSSNDKKIKKKRKLETCALGSEDMSLLLEEVLLGFCDSGGLAGMRRVDGETCLALATPLMHRVHKLVRQSGDLVFVDSYGDTDHPKACCIIFLVTYSSIGPIPVGCLLMTAATITCMTTALELWKQVLSANRFYGKNDGPDLFLTSQNELERQSFKIVFPKSQTLVCLSHILKDSWSLVWDHKHPIKKDQRALLFSKIKLILFSQSVEELEMNYALVSDDSLVKLYPMIVDHVKNLYDHRYDWSLVYRQHLLPQTSDVTFFWETAMIVLKDPILSRTRIYNPLQVIDFVSRLDSHYVKKLVDLANNRFDNLRLSRFLFIDLPREAYTITQLSESEYEVHNDTKDTTYQVDVTLGMCQCRVGRSGCSCKHQLLIYHNFPIPVYDCMPPSTIADKNLLLQLATGELPESHDSTSLTVAKTAPPAVSEECSNDIGIDSDRDFFMDESDACAALSQEPRLNHQMLKNSMSASDNSLIQTTIVQTASALLIQGNESQTISQLDESQPISELDESQTISELDESQAISQLNETSALISNNDSIGSPLPQAPLHCENNSSESQIVTNLLSQIYVKLKDRVCDNPRVFEPALSVFLNTIDKMPSCTLEQALYSFGKFSNISNPLLKRKDIDDKVVELKSHGIRKKKQRSVQTYKLRKQS